MLGLTTPETKVTEQKAPGLSGYPQQSDAEYAIKNNFGYGTGLEPYINVEVARVYNKVERGNLSDVIKGSTTNERLDTLKNLGLREKIGTVFTQAALAANRSAIATLGFDPTKINLQTKMGNATLGGFYSPKEDQTWMNVVPGNESAIVHESIHRGLEKLQNSSKEAKDILEKLPEERLVRYMMYKTMGDPEGGQGEVDARQRKEGVDYFSSSERQKLVARLEELAAEQHKKNRPRGPR